MYDEADPSGDLLITLLPSSEPFATEAEESCSTLSEDFFLAAAGLDSLEMWDLEEDDDDIGDEPEPLRIKVSSKRLCQAAARFKKMLTGPWIEATTVYDDGLRHIDMDGFDVDAFRVVMHVIHGNDSRVPSVVDLDTLVKIALVVDDLHCAEAVAAFAALWISGVRMQLPDVCNRDLVLWIFVSYTLRLLDIFHTATSTAMFNSQGPIPTYGLPIRQGIVGKYTTSPPCLTPSCVRANSVMWQTALTTGGAMEYRSSWRAPTVSSGSIAWAICRAAKAAMKPSTT